MERNSNVIVIPANPEMAKIRKAQRQLRVAAYCRVSTDDEEQLTSYEAQKNYYTDKIMTKSISRFARNTVDCLNYIRVLKEMGIALIFEKENINTLETDSEIFITMLGAFARAESESISANVRWGKRQAMREGKAIIQYNHLYGYEKGEDGNAKIIPDQAEVVRKIYEMLLTGASLRKIKEYLESEGIQNASGKECWSIASIRGILSNEKYCGDVLLQKTFIEDCISKKVARTQVSCPCI